MRVLAAVRWMLRVRPEMDGIMETAGAGKSWSMTQNVYPRPLRQRATRLRVNHARVPFLDGSVRACAAPDGKESGQRGASRFARGSGNTSRRPGVLY